MNAFDREIEHLEDMLDRGEITEEEYRKEVRELERDYRESMRESAEEAARAAYEAEMDRWGW